MGRSYQKYGSSRKSSGTNDRNLVLTLICAAVFIYLGVKAYLGFMIFLAIAVAVFLFLKIRAYRKGAYFQITRAPFLAVLYNTGRYGEYLTYKKLKKYESRGAKFLFNVYIPKENGETTEIDVLMITARGLFVIESKNYSGWIFGNEYQMTWYQTLPSGKKSHKEQFYNPIMQNASHIKYLKAFLGAEVPTRSIIAFSERCTLKRVDVKSTDIAVINRQHIARVIDDIWTRAAVDVLNEAHIQDIYTQLYPLTQVTAAAKAQHVDNIKKKHPAAPVSAPPPAAPVTAVPLPPQEFPADPATSPIAEKACPDQQAACAPAQPNVAEKTMPAESACDKKAPQKCPRCGGTLVLRTATRGANAGGQFYGCSNYPKCRYLQNLPKKTST